MKSKTILIILVVVFILIVLFARGRSQIAPTTTLPETTNNQSIDDGAMQKNNTGQNAQSIDTDLQSLNNIIDGINNEDFAETTLDDIE